MAKTMNTRILINLLFTAGTLLSSQAFANSPAMMDIPESSNIQPPNEMSQDKARPAEQATKNTRAVQSGTVLDDTSQVMAVRKLDFPRRGMSEDKVRNELGQPVEIKPAVGKPPISQWLYDDRIIYFEFSNVVHVVAR